MCLLTTMFHSKTILLTLLLSVCFSTHYIAAQRGGGRAGSRRVPGGKKVLPCPMQTALQDVNANASYYNNPQGARITKFSHFDYEYMLGHKVVFICEARGYPRPYITWFKDGLELYSHPYFQLHEWKTGLDMIKSKMEIDPATQMDAGVYECQANNQYFVDCRTFKADFSIGE